MTQGLDADSRDFWLTKPAFATAAVEISFELLAAFAIVFEMKAGFPFGTATGGHGVMETKGDELHDAGRVVVRQITACVPAEETAGLGLGVERFGPGAFARDEMAETGIARRFTGADWSGRWDLLVGWSYG